ncbi:MAG: PAS-domain containing protein, partial [Pseudomonadota bacterium]
MAVSVDQVPVIIAAGAAATGLSMMLWALRISDGARGLARKYKDRAQSLEQKLARADSVFGAHPGVILVWDDDVLEDEGADIPIPEIQGSPAALANLLRYTDDAVSADPAVRIVEGLADLEARDSARRDTTLRQSLRELRENGTPFSLTLSSVDGRFLEADGRTAGARAVVWLTDSTIRHGEISVRNNVIEEARQVIARDPTAFLDMLRKAPFPAWRVSGMGKLQWANPAYLRAVEQDDLERAIDKNAILDAKSAALTKRTINDGDDIDETVHIVIAGQRRAMRVLTFPLSGGAGAMAFDVTEQEEAREELNRHVKAHDDTLNHVTDAVAIFGPDRRLVFHNEAFRKMWDLDEGFLIDGPSHGDVLDRLREHRKLPARTDFATWRAEELAYHLDPGKIHEDKWSLPDNRTLTVTRQRHPLGGLLLLFRDITGQLDLQTKYNALIKTQSATLDSLHEACAVFGGDAQLKLHNRAF